MEKDQTQLATTGETLTERLERLTEFSDPERLILKLLIIQKIRIGLNFRLTSRISKSAPKNLTDEDAKILSLDQASLGLEENNTTLAIASQLGISPERFKELTIFVIEHEQTW